MKIQRVEFSQLRYPLEPRYGDANGLKAHRSTVLVRLQTSDDIVGWGEFFTQRVVPDHLRLAAEVLEGAEALASAPLVDRLSAFDRRLAAGIDIALWDIRGKRAGMSIAALLGGPYRTRQPAYASHQNVSEAGDVTAAAVAEAEASLARGFRALKMKVGWHPPEVDLAWIERVLAVLPPDVPLALDANRALDLATARRMGRRLGEEARIAWFEEPLSNAHPEAYRELRGLIEMPIAGGESMDEAMLQAVITTRAMDIINPDLVGHGGVRRFQHLFALADAHGVRLVPHVFDGQLIRVATLHMLAAQPDWSERQSWFRSVPLECDVSPNPLRDELLDQPLRPDAEGAVAVPEGPGLGVDINPELLQRFAI